MKSLFIKLFLLPPFIIYSFITVAQTNYVDSAKKVLLTQKEDTNRVNTFRALDLYFYNNNDSLNFFLFANEALSLSKKINFKKGIGNAYRDIGHFYLNDLNNYSIALKYYIASFDIRKLTNDSLDIANGYYNLANCYGKLKDYHNSLINANEALSHFRQINNFPDIADTYTMIGLMYFDQGNYPEETINLYAALKIYEQLGDKTNIGSTLQYIGAGYEYQGNYTEALTNLKAALNVRKETNDKSAIAQTLISIGTLYINDSNYSNAINYFLQGLQLFKEAGKDAPDWGLAYAYQSLSQSYERKATVAFETHDKKSGKSALLQALQYGLLTLSEYKTINSLDGISSGDMKLGNLYLALDSTKKAKYFLRESINMYKRFNTLPAYSNAYFAQTTLDSINGNLKRALVNYKIAMNYQFAMSNDESKKKIVQTQMQYDFDKKETITKAEQDKKDAEAKRIKNQQYFVIATLGLIVLAVLTIALTQFRNNKQKKKANLLLQREKQKVEATLSELKSTQSQLVQSEKMASLGELTAGIAHEIQNPLNFVNNFSEVNRELIQELKDEIQSDNKENAIAIANDLDENEQKINHHGKRADAIVKGMLQHSRSSTGLKELTDINTLADEYLRLSYHGLRAKDKSFNATMKTDFDNTIGKINIIPQDIGRVLLNLYNNAFYAVAEKKKQQSGNYEPTVSVSTKKINDKIVLTVMDNGNGIPQKVVDKIFQPFFTTKPTGQGTGLGLSLSYDIVKAHGGEIKVNTREGDFTEFNINLPL